MKKPELYSVIGSPVAHSISPVMHNHAFKLLDINAHYIPIDTEGKKLEDVVNSMVTLGFSGWNVTMPDKTEMARLCDELSPEAKMIGAVNTVVNNNGYLTGFSTDGIGFFRNLREHGFYPENKKAVLLGAGGAARSIAASALQQGLSELVIYNRTLSKAEQLREALVESDVDVRVQALEDTKSLSEDIKGADLVINATSVGMGSSETVFDTELLKPEATVADIIYKPRETNLLKAAREKGIKTVDGLGMLIWQGAYAFKYWTGLEFPVDTVVENLF